MDDLPVFQVHSWNNFCRVFRLPDNYPKGFCFGGGLPTTFTMVDWFYPVPDMSIASISMAEWDEKFGSHEIKEISLIELMKSLVPFLREKNYFDANNTYLVICAFGAAFTFDGKTNVDV